jgi:hypothetical protein
MLRHIVSALFEDVSSYRGPLRPGEQLRVWWCVTRPKTAKLHMCGFDARPIAASRVWRMHSHYLRGRSCRVPR